MTDTERALELLKSLAVDEPCTTSFEGLDDGCFWCGGDSYYPGYMDVHGAIHDHNCPWVAARRFLGLEVGDGNPVRPEGSNWSWRPTNGPAR